MDGIVKNETERQEREYEAQMEELTQKHKMEMDALQAKCKMQQERIAFLTTQRDTMMKYIEPSKRNSLWHKAKENFAYIMACLCAVGEKLKLVEYGVKEKKAK